MDKNNSRPVFLNLLKIRMPVTAVLSISHRLSGVVLALLIPAALYVFSRSLENEQGFRYAIHLFEHPAIKFGLLLLRWFLALHLFAGIRFLLIDYGLCVNKLQARASAWTVQALALLCVVMMLVLLL